MVILPVPWQNTETTAFLHSFQIPFCITHVLVDLIHSFSNTINLLCQHNRTKPTYHIWFITTANTMLLLAVSTQTAKRYNSIIITLLVLCNYSTIIPYYAKSNILKINVRIAVPWNYFTSCMPVCHRNNILCFLLLWLYKQTQ